MTLKMKFARILKTLKDYMGLLVVMGKAVVTLMMDVAGRICHGKAPGALEGLEGHVGGEGGAHVDPDGGHGGGDGHGQGPCALV